MKKKMLLLGGNWVEDIRESGYISKLYKELKKFLNLEYKNGGTQEELDFYFNKLDEYSVVFWFVNIPNTYEKSVDQIKLKYQNILLVTSKNNLDGKYSNMEIVSRLLKVKANLGIVFTKKNEKIAATVMDPLNNVYCFEEEDVFSVATALATRVNNLLTFTRRSSIQVGSSLTVPDDPEFFELARNFAETFHSLIHPEHTERFLGNLSFRCEEGFPSFMKEGIIYVSRRNVDKRQIGKESFVPILMRSDAESVLYFGDNKPSVDSPTLVELYNFYKEIRYTIHSHVYVEGAPFTLKKIPCGAMEEVEEIKYIFKDGNQFNFAINLLGHGSIVFAKDLDYLRTIKHYARPNPEK